MGTLTLEELTGDVPTLYNVFSRETTPSSPQGASKSQLPSQLHHLVHSGAEIIGPWECLMGNKNSITKFFLGHITWIFVIKTTSLG
jgi:hypothetical protein